MRIIIHDEPESTEDLVLLLEEIIRLIKQGFSSGVNPNWDLKD